MRAAAMSSIRIVDAAVRLLAIWHAQQAIGVYHTADLVAVFEMPLYAPPQIDISAHRNICIKSEARVVEEGKWGGEKKPKPGEKKPEQKPDKKKPRRDGGREPREPRQPNRNYSTPIPFLFAR